MGAASIPSVARKLCRPAAMALLFSSCVASIGGRDVPPPPPPDGGSVGPGGGGRTSGGAGGTPAGVVTPVQPFACNTSTKPPAAPMRRLTMTQYQNTIADLVTWAA